ncbi:MAG: adenylyltransferase/cytidyltransferase family protein [Gammaproteobacteria bacterium SHHR-1]
MRVGGVIGVFDLLHLGHLRFLQAARSRCDHLKVGLGTDRLVQSSKGICPVIDQSQRQELVAALRCVDETCLFDIGLDNIEPALEWLLAWQVDCLFIGSDWVGTPRWQRLEPRLAEQGTDCIWLPYTSGISSSIIRQRLGSDRDD